MRISDWSSDVCSSDLRGCALATGGSLLRRRLAEQNLDLRALAQVFIDGRGRLLLQLAAQVLLHLLLGRRLGHRAALDLDAVVRSEESRGGKGGVRTCRTGWAPQP